MVSRLRQRLQPYGVELWFTGVICLLYAYFFNAIGWNQNARYDAIFSFVEPGPDMFTFRIEGFLPDVARAFNTGDWAQYGGHYYSNKAPGTSLLGVLLYAPLYWVERLFGAAPTSFVTAHFNAYLLNLGVSVVPAALAAGYFLAELRKRHSGHGRGVLAVATAYAVGTFLFPYSTQLWGHGVAASFLLAGMLSVTGASLSRHGGIVAGALFGVAVLMDYLAAPTVLCALVYAVYRWRSEARWLVVGGAPAAVVLFGYNAWCFGSPWSFPPSFSNPLFLSSDHVGGLFGGFDAGVFFALFVSWGHGLLVYCPVLIFSLVGAATLWWHGQRVLVVLCAVSILGTTALIACFSGWHGGGAVGGRYTIITLPSWGLLLSGVLHARPWVTYGLRRVATLSAANMFMLAAVTNQLRGDYPKPLLTLYQWFFAEQLGFKYAPVRLFQDLSEDQWRLTKFNLGQLLGLSALPSVLLAVVLTWAGLWVVRKRMALPFVP